MEILSSAFSELEVILCKENSLDLVWAQVLSDPFLRRLIIRYTFLSLSNIQKMGEGGWGGLKF